MNIGYLRLDHGEWTQGAYNSQEIGLAKAFAKLGHKVLIFYNIMPNDENVGKTVSVADGVDKTYLPAKNIVHHALLNPFVLDKYSIDLLHIQGDNLLGVAAVVMYAKLRKIPYYCYVGRIDSENTGKFHRLLAKIMVQPTLLAYRHSKVFAKTSDVKYELERKHVKNVTVAPVGLDQSIIPVIKSSKIELRDEKNLPQDKKIVLCVSRLVPGKQPYDIFKLATMLDKSFHFIFIGTRHTEDEELFRKTISQKSLQERFTYIPHISNQEIHKYYKLADAVVNFNQNEIFGMAILEAMYQEATVVAISAPGPRCIIEDKKSGYLANSVKEMANILKDFKNVGRAAKERVINEFSWDHTAKVFLYAMNLYKNK